jgi:hypothetical protein
MGNPLSSPDWAYVVGAALTAVPAAIVGRRNRGAAQTEGQATRTAVTDALNQAVGTLSGRLDGVDSKLSDVQSWQAAHTTEHAIGMLTATDLRRSRFERRTPPEE